MDKYDLTQEQWDAMAASQLRETPKAIDSGALEPIYYEKRGWDAKGRPTKEKLEELGL